MCFKKRKWIRENMQNIMMKCEPMNKPKALSKIEF